jgi:YfiR/HmsC-like
MLIANKNMQRSLPSESSRPGRRQGIRTNRALVVSLLLAGLAIPSGIAQSAKPADSDVKAAYLLNFGKFVRQSSGQSPRSSFDVCLLGHDPMGRNIDDLAAKQSIANLPVHVRRLSDVTQAKGCAIVYFSSDENDRIREDLAILSPLDTLTVGDASDFLDRGGMIQFMLVEKTVRFSVNLDAVSRAHLVLSSELLRVASSVNGKPPTLDRP